MRVTRSKWFVPLFSVALALFSVALGILVFVAQWIGGGSWQRAIMTASEP